MTDETKTKEQLVQELKVLRQEASELHERIIELEALEAERAQAEALLRIQRDLGTDLSSTSDLTETLNLVLEAILQIEGIDCGGVYLVDPLTGALNLAVHTGLSPEFVKRGSHFDVNSPHALLVMAGDPIYKRYVELLPLKDEIRQREGLRASAVIPVKHGGQVIAVLNLASHTHEEIPVKARHGLEAIAAQIGGVIAHARAETALQENQRNLQTLFDTVDDFIFILGTDGRILRVNPLVQQRLGYSEEELIGRQVSIVHPPDRQEEVAAIIADVIVGRISTCSVPLRTKEGTLIPVEIRVTRGQWSGQEVLFGIARDITERKQAKEKLQKSEDRFRAMFETMTEGVALHEIIYNRDGTAVDYVILDVNPAYQTQTGIAREDAPGRRASELYGTGVAPFLDIYGQVAATGESIRFEAYFEPMQKHFSISIFSPITGQFATVFEDITERKQAEEELRQYHDRLEELVTERTTELEMANAELSQYAYVVSHDLRAPIRALNGYSLFLQEDCTGQLDDDCLEYIEGIGESARRMDTLVVDLLEYSRIGRIQIETSEVDSGKLLKRIATNLNLEEQARVILPANAPVIRAQSVQLEQIFANLLSNAAKFHRPDSDRVVAVEWADRGDRWEFSVRDNGIGIREQHQKKIFGIFQRLHTQEEYEGTGIGLAIVRKAVEEHDGQIWVQSTPGQGAVFSFTLPKQTQEG